MGKDIIIYEEIKNSGKNVEDYNDGTFNTIYARDLDELKRNIKVEEDAFAVVLFCDDEEQIISTKNTISILKDFEEMQDKAIFVVFESDDFIEPVKLRKQDDFVVRPFSTKVINKRLNILNDIFMATKRHKEENDDLFLMYVSMTKLVSTVFNMMIPGARGHCEAVSDYTSFIATRYQEKYPDRMTKRDVTVLSNLVLLHDIGLIYVDRNLAYTGGELGYEEFLELRKHPLIGGQLFRRVRDIMYEKYGHIPKFIKSAIEITEYHHELGDGSGYPFGLEGQNIPLFARLVSIGELFAENLINAEGIDDVLGEIVDTESENPKFDKEIVEIALENIEEIKKIALEIEKKQTFEFEDYYTSYY